VRRIGLKSMQFVDSKPQLAELSDRMGRCNCPPNDPDIIDFGPTG